MLEVSWDVPMSFMEFRWVLTAILSYKSSWLLKREKLVAAGFMLVEAPLGIAGGFVNGLEYLLDVSLCIFVGSGAGAIAEQAKHGDDFVCASFRKTDETGAFGFGFCCFHGDLLH